MTGPIIQSAINFSEGRRTEVIAAIIQAIRDVPGATLADYSADPSHNRMVASILGGPEALFEAAIAASKVAIERIDLREHTGAHPRIGAVDVLPVVPIRYITMPECVALSHRIGQELAARFHLPVYFYERSAESGRTSALPELRKGGFEGLFTAPLTGDRVPDAGPHHPHPTAGAAIVGARNPLVAYNINLTTTEVSVARRIAAKIREGRLLIPELQGVRALGLWLPSQGQAQVSMNLTLPDLSPMPAVFDFVRRHAEEQGVEVAESEIIGLIPRASLGGEPPDRILWHGYRETQVIEYWLEKPGN
jgi:glutamate formiminotransferase